MMVCIKCGSEDMITLTRCGLCRMVEEAGWDMVVSINPGMAFHSRAEKYFKSKNPRFRINKPKPKRATKSGRLGVVGGRRAFTSARC